MANKDRADKWLDIVAEDLSVAELLFNNGHWLYTGFMCHQVIEKTLKAYWCIVVTMTRPIFTITRRLPRAAASLRR